jgi:hypothetical protein
MVVHVNGKKVIDVNDFKKSDTSQGLTAALIGFDPSFGDRYSDMKFAIDDIYMSDAQARVEISSSSEWQPNIESEILTTKSWSGSEVVVDANIQMLDTSDNLYIYVFDNNGKVNHNGFSVLSPSLAPSSIEYLIVK